MQFAPIDHSDIDKIKDLQPDGWPDIVPSIKYYMDSPFCTPSKVLSHNKIVGIGASIKFKNTSWLAHIIVSPEYRKKGIGFCITDKLVKDTFTGPTHSVSLIATKLGESVYRKAGFREVSEYKAFQRIKPWLAREISESIIPYKEKFIEQVYDLDASVTGEDRRELLKDHLHAASLYIETDKLLGYFMPTLGEGLIIADQDKAGLELMQLKYATIDKAVLPSENIAGIEFLLGNGFQEVKTALRMCIGKEINWRPEKVYSRIGGNFG